MKSLAAGPSARLFRVTIQRGTGAVSENRRAGARERWAPNSVVVAVRSVARLLLHQERTFTRGPAMSQKCHERKWMGGAAYQSDPRLPAGTRYCGPPRAAVPAGGAARHPGHVQRRSVPSHARLTEDFAGDWRRLDERIEGISDEIESLARQDQACERLMTVPGIGPIISSPTTHAPTRIWPGASIMQKPPRRATAKD